MARGNRPLLIVLSLLLLGSAGKCLRSRLRDIDGTHSYGVVAISRQLDVLRVHHPLRLSF